MLCVLVWVLEAMRMDSPYHMTSFHKCWNREQTPPDETRGKRAYDLNKSQLNKWEKLQRQNKVCFCVSLSLFQYSVVSTGIAMHRLLQPPSQASKEKRRPATGCLRIRKTCAKLLAVKFTVKLSQKYPELIYRQRIHIKVVYRAIQLACQRESCRFLAVSSFLSEPLIESIQLVSAFTLFR